LKPEAPEAMMMMMMMMMVTNIRYQYRGINKFKKG
jgi:hypothetical protein